MEGYVGACMDSEDLAQARGFMLDCVCHIAEDEVIKVQYMLRLKCIRALLATYKEAMRLPINVNDTYIMSQPISSMRIVRICSVSNQIRLASEYCKMINHPLKRSPPKPGTKPTTLGYSLPNDAVVTEPPGIG